MKNTMMGYKPELAPAPAALLDREALRSCHSHRMALTKPIK